MSLHKWCGCLDCPKCDHAWFYDFRVNGRRYRATTDTANKQQAKDIEARERGFSTAATASAGSRISRLRRS